ncbi:hypothetical protein FA95DRAFT_1574840 [Auriscalpium vulgare]|uniref:Uncharacterized protein n=1 Tax=Auriscalpium vulgare TaxID=40419 RepID=A0ACB8RK09_9AGAM|nr:hypothetical protein FA95DRAFT_1574840 [Auriscalpium vulgare]
MPDWKDPIIVAQDYLILAKIIHIVAGIAIWEFVVTCDFELAVLTGRRPYRWTIWIYVGCRVSLLVTLICGIIPLEYTKCRTSAYFAIGLASSMIVLRIIAIWDRNVYACGLAIAVWLGSFALNIRHVTLVHSVYNPVAGVCIPLDTVNNLANGIGIMVSDIGLLALMLAGILRHQPYVHMKLLGRNSLWALLWNQGLMWLVIASVAEVPALVGTSLTRAVAFTERTHAAAA